MTADVIEWGGITKLKIDPARVLGNAPRDMQSVVVVGFDADGNFYFASSEPDSAEVIYLLERAKHELLKLEDKMSEGD